MNMDNNEYSEEEIRRALARKEKADKQASARIRYALNAVALNKRIRKWRKLNSEAKKRERKRRQQMYRTPLTQGARVNAYLRTVKKKAKVMHKEAVYKHLRELEKAKAEQFIEDNLNPRTKTVMCILGASGVGKTLAALHLQAKHGANVVCSYTTRKPRKGEINGRDHYFTDIIPPEDTLLAYTMFGGHKYYTLKTQITGPVTVYVIDEKGYKDLKKRSDGKYRLYTVFVKRRPMLRKVCGVSEYRMRRDDSRDFGSVDYDAVVENNGTKGEFFQQMEDIYYKLLEEAKQYGW